jgi:hypothetical protein
MNPSRLAAILAAIVLLPLLSACSHAADSGSGPYIKGAMASGAKAIFLHHSTGSGVWSGGVAAAVASLNAASGSAYEVGERAYPNSPWPWDNYPSDYYRLWVGGEGSATDANIQTLDAICAEYDLVIWKHCYPVANIGPDGAAADPASGTKTLANYKAAYDALKTKMRSFPNKRFIVWTGAALLQSSTTPEQAQRFKSFRDWVVDSWDEAGDNIFVFDFWTLETGGGLYLPAASSGGDDHPSAAFNQATAPKFAERVMDVLQGRGDTDPLTGL